MSPEFTGSCGWGGRRVARRITEGRPRCRMVVSGCVLEHATIRVGDALSGVYTFDDGTGSVDLIFLGRAVVAGLREGVWCTIEGTAQPGPDRLVIWNPLYRIDPPVRGPDPRRGTA